MPKKNKRRKNAKNNKGPTAVRALIQKGESQEYAVILKMLGDRHVSLKCYDGVDRRGRIRGKLRGRRCWMNPEDHVLVALRDFSEKCVDVIHKYNEDEVRRLRKMGQLVETGKFANLVESASEDEKDEEEGFIFEEI